MDLDKRFEEKAAKLAGPTTTQEETKESAAMSEASKGMISEPKAEEALANQLFGGEAADVKPAKSIPIVDPPTYEQLINLQST